MEDIIESVYAVYGDEFPSRSDFSSDSKKPFPALTVTKAFKTWSKFKTAYMAHAIQCRNTKAAASVVTKPVKSGVAKHVVK